MLDRESAQTYAGWFRALADPTRVQILNLLAAAGAPMTVGRIVEQVEVGQSTVSAHLKILTEAGFVLAEPQGTARLYQVNQRCVADFPSAADAVMRRSAPRAANSDLRIVPATDEHADAILAIYQAGLDTGEASFETTAPDWATWDATRLPSHRFVALDDGDRVLGWVAVTPVSSRCVYAGVVEHSVYVDPGAHGRGVGIALLDRLIASTEADGIWTIQSGIFPENTASRALHRRAGFREVGIRQRIGAHHGRWRDVVLVERRS
ncbi:L-amino acid N-acyltransferase YncA [Amycolatopsis xylanica]|uniref:L-amino acid N-acyltransferase YncA n=1 Tax=Amycolatopsis xylanica TaxID=589385 RepID=A0A1H3RY83_9PSEU|nr:metalloregulator ArsR/SmtB family transcription factor [Amycolatopsis xylanica]SDZ30221.1 L-amino acid N-acyltransferase YncA [Amycolatopsis xylanica]